MIRTRIRSTNPASPLQIGVAFRCAKNWLKIFFALFFISSTRTYALNHCLNHLLQSLRIVTFNTCDLFALTNGHPPKKEERGFHLTHKSTEHFKRVGATLKEINADIMVLQEVINHKTLLRLQTDFLSSHEFIEDFGNDPLGKDTVFLIRKNLNLRFDRRFYRYPKWIDPTRPEHPSLLFPRGLPTLFIKSDSGETLLILMGIHLKSKISRNDDPGSNIWRSRQIEELINIVKSFNQEARSDIPLILAGDFNGNLVNESFSFHLKNMLGLHDVFDVISPRPSELDRITHTFHPQGEIATFAQLDGVLVSKSLKTKVRNAFVYRYKNDLGETLPFPFSLEDREKNPSDHYPVVVDLEEIVSLRSQ